MKKLDAFRKLADTFRKVHVSKEIFLISSLDSLDPARKSMANVFVLLRDEKKSPQVEKRRQIPLQILDLKSSGKSGCGKSLMVRTNLRLFSPIIKATPATMTFEITKKDDILKKMAKSFVISSGYACFTLTSDVYAQALAKARDSA